MEKKLTAMQQNIEKINAFIKYVEKSDSTSDMKDSLLTIFNSIKNNAISLLPIERAMIEDAYLDGNDDDKDAAKYFTQTYETE